ncbi:MAG: hypothetical protein EAZ77_05435 [Nostocales cyanobacterium]|nr:MAG: hypothetical protein EAZ77_05435 [Nostocales cyanobacterium]
MKQLHDQYKALQRNIEDLIGLLLQESHENSQHEQLLAQARASLNKALSSEFEVVFAGQFSAGKSMLLKALLQRDLLFSGEGHATGTLCYIRYASSPDEEKVVLTFMSKQEIMKQLQSLADLVDIKINDFRKSESLSLDVKALSETATNIINQEGGKNRSTKAKQAACIIDLLKGISENQANLADDSNKTEQKTIEQASEYARAGSKSAVLKQIDYFCHEPLLEGNVLIDTPGIDAPLERDAELTFKKVSDPETAAVICVFQTAKVGEITTEETRLIEATKANRSIRDRVFWIFNLIDLTWYNSQLREKLSGHKAGFYNAYETSSLLGFYASMVAKSGNEDNKFGLSSIFQNGLNSKESEIFLNSFKDFYEKRYKPNHPQVSLQTSGVLKEDYLQILRSDHGKDVLNAIIKDSGIEQFREAISNYLIKEKRPSLYKALAEDVEKLCTKIVAFYSKQKQVLELMPKDIQGIEEELKDKELLQLRENLDLLSSSFEEDIRAIVDEVIKQECPGFEPNILKIHSLSNELLTFIDNLSFKDVFSKVIRKDDKASEKPFTAIFSASIELVVEHLEELLIGNFPFSYEDVESEKSNPLVKFLIDQFFIYLEDFVEQTSSYRNLLKEVNASACHDLIDSIQKLKIQVWRSVHDAISIKCHSFLRESDKYYRAFENNQFSSVMGSDKGLSLLFPTNDEQEELMRKALKADFVDKFAEIIFIDIRRDLNYLLKRYLLELATKKSRAYEWYEVAREEIIQNLTREANQKKQDHDKQEAELQDKIAFYHKLVDSIEDDFVVLNLNNKLPRVR